MIPSDNSRTLDLCAHAYGSAAFNAQFVNLIFNTSYVYCNGAMMLLMSSMLIRQSGCHADARLAAQQPGRGRTSAAEVFNQEDVEEEEGDDDFLPAAVIEAVKRSR